MSRDIDLLTEIRDLLLVLAGPALVERDKKLRDGLRAITGKSRKSAKAISLMDGSRSQSVIAKEAEIDRGQLSRLVKSLAEASLIASDEKHPKLLVPISEDFFDEGRR